MDKLPSVVLRFFVVASAVAVSTLISQSLAAPPERPAGWYRELPTKPDRTLLNENHYPDLIYIKFLDNSKVRAENGRLVSEDTAEQFELSENIEFMFAAKAAAEPMLKTEPERLREYREVAMRNRGREVADLTKWFLLRVPDSTDTAAWIDKFNRLDSVEIALPVPKPAPPPQSCGSSSCEYLQTYLNPPSSSPKGVNAHGVWSQYGVAGQGVKITNIEYNYQPHNDFPSISNLLGNDPSGSWFEHGTMTIGVIGSVKNSFGMSGISHDSTVYFAKDHHPDTCGSITAAMNAMQQGDVIVIEKQVDSDYPQGKYVPIEWYQPWYDCIVTAVGNGYVVVISAGNGAQNLDSAFFNTGHKPFLSQNDSGSIIVGGGISTTQEWNTISTYGSRVNVQGWGNGAWTTRKNNGYGTYGGTSAATAIVGGVAALVQSAVKSQTGQAATPAQIRQALIGTGTPQAPPLTEHIGPLPDALAAAQSLAQSGTPGIPPNFQVSSWLCYGQGEASWGAAAGASSYQLQASYSSSFSSPWYEYVGSGQWVYLDVSYKTYFRVRACNGANCGSYTSAQSLTPLSGCY